MIRKIAIAGETVTQVCQIVNTMIIAKGMFTWFFTNEFYIKQIITAETTGIKI